MINEIKEVDFGSSGSERKKGLFCLSGWWEDFIEKINFD